ncbi:MAG: glycosyltransferase family 4 protein [Candidatus Hydrogenedentes bacterium]|nr:glycosyltransferase family 4 protein [Candidatus Hydrogenedentota bacterium]
MKIIYIAPGTGGTFYCQNCMRDVSLVRAMRRYHHEVTLVPVYLPIMIDARDVARDVPVFFGGINVYLQQKFPFFRKTPRWLDRLFDAPHLLRLAAQREGSTEAAGLGPMTLSVLRGEDGNQKKELDRLLDWLEAHEKPDLVHLSNSLFAGLAGEIKRRLRVPVVCSLQDEENWVDAMAKPYDQLCWDAMAEKKDSIDAFVAVSEWYGNKMSARMKLDKSRLHIVPLGVELDARGPAPLPFDPPVIGYLSKMCKSLGLGLLVDAFIALKKKPELRNLRLRATGGQHGPDAAFIKELREKLRREGMDQDVEFREGFNLEERREFLRSLTVLSVPARCGEAFGLHIIEAMGEGVPVVQPHAGGYPEVIRGTGGGLLYDPDDPGGLVSSLESLLRNPEHARQLGAQGREAVGRFYTVDVMAAGIAKVYESLL